MRVFPEFRRLALSALSLVALAAPLAAPASADIYVTDVEFSVGTTANEDTVDIWGTGFANYIDVYDGQLTFTIGNNSSLPAGTKIPVWCVDIYHDIGLGLNGGFSQPIHYTVGTLTNNHDGQALSQQQINAMSWLIVAGDAYLTTHQTVDVSGAIQLAIWDLEYGTTYGGSGFAYKNASSANMVVLMNTYLANAWANRNNSAYDSYVYTLDNPTIQSFGAFESGAPVNPPNLVPEPATLGLLGTGLLALAACFGLRRRRKSATTAGA